MNKPIRRVAITCLLLFAILLVNDNVVQFADAKTLRDKPGNTRLLFQQYDRKRGDIVTSTGVTIASSIPTTDALKYLRTYPNGPLFAPVTGYYSIVYGASQIESSENSILAGSDDRLFGVQQLSNLITGRTPEGGSVVLTIDPVLAAGCLHGARRSQGCGRRARPDHRRDPRAGELAVVRPEHVVVARSGDDHRLLEEAAC